jgi:hypothetical protein
MTMFSIERFGRKSGRRNLYSTELDGINLRELSRDIMSLSRYSETNRTISRTSKWACECVTAVLQHCA